MLEEAELPGGRYKKGAYPLGRNKFYNKFKTKSYNLELRTQYPSTPNINIEPGKA